MESGVCLRQIPLFSDIIYSVMYLKNKIKETVFDYVTIMLGTAIYSAAVCFILEPAKVSPGGITGIAVILHDTLSVPTGVSVLLLNIPLIILGFMNFGSGFIIKTAISVFLTSLYLDAFEMMGRIFTFDMVISSIFGGILLGLGLGLVMLRGSTTGGVDIAVKLINKKNKKLPIGKLFLMIDSLVILTAALVYRNIETALYSVIAVFISSHIVDLVLYGKEEGRIFFIITENGDSLKREILSSAGRGVTLIKAEGGYTGSEKTVLMCAARASEIKKIRRIIFDNDMNAFFFVANVSGINGEGFDREE